MPRSAEQLRRLNVGCGPHHLRADWWNVDAYNFPGVDQVHDVTQPWPWCDLEFVYAEHFLEHLAPLDALTFLRSALGALRQGGRIRVSTPSLEWVIRTHFTFREDPSDARKQTFATNRAFHGWGHQFLYSRATLEWFLRGTGFQEVEFFDYGESGTPALRGLERHGNYSHSGEFPSVWIAEGSRRGSLPPLDRQIAAEIREHFVRYIEARD